MKPRGVSLFFCATVFIAGTTGAPAAGIAGDHEETRLVRLYERLAPSTIFLSVLYESSHPLSQPATTGVGAGFVVDDKGTVLTNAHVVDGANSIVATLFDGTRVNADVLALDPVADVAILLLLPANRKLVPVTLGNSDRLHIGEHTSVVGSPFGLGFTLTTGIISGLGPPARGVGTVSSRLIQTTAPINPGNSGGPLVDSRGRVIGITTAVLLGAQNIGFAIPINLAKRVLEEWREKGKLDRPWLGVTGKFVTDEIRTLLALPLHSGLLVEDVEDGSPAATAGLKLGTIQLVHDGIPWVLGGDILVAIQGQSIGTTEEFLDAVKPLRAGQEIEIELMRNGEHLHTRVVLTERPAGSLRSVNTAKRHAAGATARRPIPGIEPRWMIF